MRLAEMMRIAGSSMVAVLVCLPMLLQDRPGTPLRVLCIGAFEYLARLRGGTLGRRGRQALAHACDFGSVRDRYYDEQKLDLADYRSLRRGLRRLAPEAATSRYIQELRQAERNRPLFSPGSPGIAGATAKYRAAVIRLSVRWLLEISGVPVGRVTLQAMIALVCLMQVADDLLDWKEDQASRCPSYVTSLCNGQTPSRMAARLRAQADSLLQRTFAGARNEAAAAPFAVAGAAAWMLVIGLMKTIGPR